MRIGLSKINREKIIIAIRLGININTILTMGYDYHNAHQQFTFSAINNINRL